MSEKKIMNQVQIAISAVGSRVFRNQVGTYKLPDGTYISSGLGPGSSDLIGWTSVEIKPHMLGKKVAVFTAIEVKSTKGKMSGKQENFICVVNQAGGIAFMVRSANSAVQKIFEGRFLGNAKRI